MEATEVAKSKVWLLVVAIKMVEMLAKDVNNNLQGINPAQPITWLFLFHMIQTNYLGFLLE